MSITSEIRLRVRKEGDVVLNQLSAKLNDVASRSTLTTAKFKDLSATLKQTDNQIKTKSINGLNDYARAWRELANNVDITSKEFKEATREAQRFEQAAAKAQRRRGSGLSGAAKGVGAIAAAGVFGGLEGAAGAGIGMVLGGPMGAAVGGALGAQVGQARQQLGATASYAAELQKQRIALAGLTKDYGEYRKALQTVERLSQQFQIPQEIITRQFTKLSASVIGAGGNLDDAEKAFKGVAAGVRGTGGDLQDLSSALVATSQVFSKGKVSAEELRQQIGERLPGAFTLFAQSLGMTPAELDKALEGGKVSLQDFQKFSELLFDKFGKSSEAIVNGPAAAGERLQVQLSKLSENAGKLLAPIGAAFQNVFTGIIRLINGAAVALNKLFKIDLSGEVESLTARIAELEKAPQRETSRQRQQRLRTLNDLRKDLKQATQQRALLSIGAGGEGGLTGLPGPGETVGGTSRTKQLVDLSQELYDLYVKQSEAKSKGNELTVIELEYQIKLQEINEKLNNKQIGQRTAKKMMLDAENKLIADTKKLDEDRAKIGYQYEQTLAGILLKTQDLTEKEKERIQNNQSLVPLIEKGMAAVAAGAISMEDFLAALRKVKDEMQGKGKEKGFFADFKESFKAGVKDMGDLAGNLGSTLAGAFGGAADALTEFLTTGTADFKEFARSVLADLTNVLVRFALFEGIKAAFPGLEFANGGIMTKDGAVPLRKYATGGIANSPQLAMFGEGSTPEAYVPLPDGRSIPVTMKGGGNNVKVDSINITVENTGEQLSPAAQKKISNQVQGIVMATLVNERRSGGVLR